MKQPLLISIATAIVLAGCQASNPTQGEVVATPAKSRAPAIDVPAVSGPPYPVGPGQERKILRQTNDGEIAITTRMLDPKTMAMTRSNGCNTTTGADDRYGPRLTWSNCRPGHWGSGSNSISSKKGQLWPFKVGNKVAYKYTSTNSAFRTVRGYRNCEVVGTSEVVAAGKTYAAYRIDCETHYGKLRYYYAPSVQTTVRFEMDHNRRGKSTVEYLEIL